MISENNDFFRHIDHSLRFSQPLFSGRGLREGLPEGVPLSAEEASGGGGGFAPERYRLQGMERVDESGRRSVRAESA